jgi:hypothetical protein
MNTLFHRIYTSVATRHFSELELAELLSQSRTANAAKSITGMLVFAEGNFFQVLEGPEEAVARLYTIIHADPRHTRITEIIREPILKRAFGEWTMGYSRLTRQEFASIEGFNDFFESGSCLEQMGQGRARKVLARFAQGRWRSNAPAFPNGIAGAEHRP